MIERVGVYCRLSDEDRFKINKTDESNSIVNQRSMCVKYAIAQNWDVIDIYSDDDFSGAGVDRPSFNRLIQDCKDGKIDIVLCKTQSRFSRDIEVIEKYLHNLFIQWRVRFVSIVDNADTSLESNKKSRQINGLMNEWYLDDLSQNIKRSLKSKREDGLFMGSFAPYGYNKSPEDKHKLIIDPVASKVVQEIFELYATGVGYYRITTHLNEKKILTPTLYKTLNGSTYKCGNAKEGRTIWKTDTIYKMLRNEVYIGNLVQGKKTSLGYKVHKDVLTPKEEWCKVENTHEPIISKELWYKVQDRLSKNYRIDKTGDVHYFSQKVYCKECGKAFIRNVSNTVKGKKAYLRCKDVKYKQLCSNHYSIRVEKLEKLVLDELNKLIKLYNDEEMLKNSYELLDEKSSINELIITLKNEQNKNNKKIDELRGYFRKLYEDKVKEIIDENIFLLMSEDYKKEIKLLNTRNDCINEEIISLNVKCKNKMQFVEMLNKYKTIDKLNKVIIDEFIDRIIIGEKSKEDKQREIQIIWNISK